MQSAHQPETQIPNDLLKRMILDPKSPLYTDPNSPYYKNPQFAALVDKARLQHDQLTQTEKALDVLEKKQEKLKEDFEKEKERFIEELKTTPIVLSLDSRKSRDDRASSKKFKPSNTHTLYKPVNNRNTEKTPLLNSESDQEFDCCKILRKIFGC